MGNLLSDELHIGLVMMYYFCVNIIFQHCIMKFNNHTKLFTQIYENNEWDAAIGIEMLMDLQIFIK